jgi:hypothetical protein
VAGRWRRSGLAAVAVVGVALALPAGDAVADHSRAMLVASAHASPGVPDASERQTSWVQLGRGGRGAATATASATCDGCSGEATGVQVVRAGGGITADNVAVAWSSCIGCSARAVSVQVVLARTGQIVATNRALAVNAACIGCSSEAVAVQFVLQGASRDEVSPSARRLLDELVAQLDDQLDAGATRSAARMRSSAADLEAEGEALRRELGAASVAVHVDRRTGST